MCAVCEYPAQLRPRLRSLKLMEKLDFYIELVRNAKTWLVYCFTYKIRNGDAEAQHSAQDVCRTIAKYILKAAGSF